LERIAGLTHTRLKVCLRELQTVGLVDAGMRMTDEGYRFLGEMTNRIIPFLEKYGFWKAH